MGAGEHNRVDAVPARRIEHRLGGRADVVDLNHPAAELGLGQLDQLGRSVADDRAVGGKLRGQVVDIGLENRCFGAEDADHAAL